MRWARGIMLPYAPPRWRRSMPPIRRCAWPRFGDWAAAAPRLTSRFLCGWLRNWDAQPQDAARQSLTQLQAAGIDQALLELLDVADARQRVELIHTLQARATTTAGPRLLQLVQNTEGEVRRAALVRAAGDRRRVHGRGAGRTVGGLVGRCGTRCVGACRVALLYADLSGRESDAARARRAGRRDNRSGARPCCRPWAASAALRPWP